MALRCRWQMQQRHWCAAVGKIEEQRKPDDFSGHRKRESSIPPPKGGHNIIVRWVGGLFFYSLRARFEDHRCNSPVDCCCHQCKHWWLLLFLPSWAKMQTNLLAAPPLGTANGKAAYCRRMAATIYMTRSTERAFLLYPLAFKIQQWGLFSIYCQTSA